MDKRTQRYLPFMVVKAVIGTLVMIVIAVVVVSLIGGQVSDHIPSTLRKAAESIYPRQPWEGVPPVKYVDIREDAGISRPSKQWSKVFDFVPLGISRCQDLFRNRNKQRPYDNRVTQLQQVFMSQVKKFKVTEGFSQAIREEYMLYYQLVRAPFVKTVCETGFNAGHSTFMWLAANNNTHVYSFDLGAHNYAKPMAAFLQQMFPGRLTVTWGDSRKTIADFRSQFPGVVCDLIIIDGGHTHDIALSDFNNFKPMDSADNILLFDDYPSSMSNFMTALGSFWEGRKRAGEVLEVFQCGFMPAKNRGFSVGRFQ